MYIYIYIEAAGGNARGREAERGRERERGRKGEREKGRETRVAGTALNTELPLLIPAPLPF